jgi:molecular chaperone DnaK
VTFDIDANGIVSVSAKDTATNKEQQIRIQASGGLSDDEVDQMVKDAEANAEEDKAKREAVEARNQAESMVNSTEKSLEEFGGELEAEDKTNIETAIADMKALLENEGSTSEELTEKTNELAQAAMKLGEMAYRKAQEEAAGDAEAPESEEADAKSDDDVVDADFTEVDGDDKK